MRTRFHIFPAAFIFAAFALSGGSAAAGPGASAAPVKVEILGTGLDNYTDYFGPTVIRYRLTNMGPGRTVRLVTCEAVLKGKCLLPFPRAEAAEECPGAYETADLKGGQSLEGRWIAASLRPSYDPDRKLALAALDESGRILGHTLFPEIKQTSPVAILAESSEDAGPIQNALLWQAETVVETYYHPDIAIISTYVPRAWYEYNSAKMVVLARKWSRLSRDEQTALRRWVSFGGVMVIIPQSCPDWKDGGWGDLAADRTGGLWYGEGRVYLARTFQEGDEPGPIDERELRDWFNSAGLFTYDHGAVLGYGRFESPPLFKSYKMPSSWLLVFLILGIIVIIGPVTHIVLAKFRRREWAWIAVPGLSLLLAFGAYGLASGVKGKESILEIRHLVKYHDGIPDVPVVTSFRMLSPHKHPVTIRYKGVRPVNTEGGFDMYMPFGLSKKAISMIRPGSLKLCGIQMQRWSHRDFRLASIVPNQPLDVQYNGDSITIGNTTGRPLRDVFAYVTGSWVSVGPVLKPGHHTRAAVPDKAVSAEELKPGWKVEGGNEQLACLLGSTIPWNQHKIADDIIVVARCRPENMPELTVTPKADRIHETTWCVWHKSIEMKGNAAP